MRKSLITILGLLLILTLCACGNEAQESVATPEVPAEVTEEPTPSPTPAPTPTPTAEPTPTPDPYTYEDDLSGETFAFTTGMSEETLSNISLACEKLDGTKILPGETFSFLEALGEVSEETGYQMAGIYGSPASEEENPPVMGGGISQVSSVIYSASLTAVLTPVERYNHEYYLSANSNVRWGCDAYVSAQENKDLKILNEFEYPVLIKLWIDEDEQKVICQMFGTNPDGVTGILKHDLISEYLTPPMDYVCVGFWNDMSRTVTDKNGVVRVDSLNYDYDGDGEPDRDHYKKFDADIVWG